MKKSDIAMIILVASVSAIIAFFAANQIPALKPNEKGVKVESVEKYQTGLADVKSEHFNASAINPTVKTVIGGESTSSE